MITERTSMDPVARLLAALNNGPEVEDFSTDEIEALPVDVVKERLGALRLDPEMPTAFKEALSRARTPAQKVIEALHEPDLADDEIERMDLKRVQAALHERGVNYRASVERARARVRSNTGRDATAASPEQKAEPRGTLSFQRTDFIPRVTVIGVGGGGTNAVDNMIATNLQGVEFVVANTDAQQLMHSRADRRIQLGPHITQGLGTGAKPEVGKAAAEEASDELSRHLDGAHMVFIAAGMGGGTGTGAAPVIARMARERNILTVGVVTKPFGFEGVRRARCADQGIEELQRHVDTLIVIPNQNLFRMANERTTWREAFKMADQALYMGVRGVTDLMMAPGLVNLDFADIRTVMAEMGKAMMGTGEAEGENRSIRAAEAAISNPLLEDTSMAGARGLLINITGGDDLTLFEVDQAANRIREEVDEEANIIFGSAIDAKLQGRIRVSVLATGIGVSAQAEHERPCLFAAGGNAMPMPQPIPLPIHAMSLRASLFPEATRSVVAAAAVQPAAELPPPSLFETVTGAFWRRQHVPSTQGEPAVQEPRAEQPRALLRQTAGDEVGLCATWRVPSPV
jgi:cell division protein FtsZ